MLLLAHRADAADFVVTSVVWNSSMYLLKVSIMTMISEKAMSVGNGSIVSISIRVIGATVDRKNWDASITTCNGVIFDMWGDIV